MNQRCWVVLGCVWECWDAFGRLGSAFRPIGVIKSMDFQLLWILLASCSWISIFKVFVYWASSGRPGKCLGPSWDRLGGH